MYETEFEFLRNKINLDECKNIGELVEKKYLIEFLGIETSLKELRVKKRVNKITSKSVSECVSEQRDKNMIEKKILYQILNKNEDVDIHINELRKDYHKILSDFENKKRRERSEDRRNIMLRELKMEKTSIISDEELIELYENKKKLLTKLHKQGDDFLREYNRDYKIKLTDDDDEYDLDNEVYDCDNGEYDVVEVESMLYNPGGAIICTRSNAMNEMSFNTKLGIYEQN